MTTTRPYASIYTLDGGHLTEGLQGSRVCDEAIQTAQRLADERSEDVLLLDDDGDWIVHPAATDGTREPADPATGCDRSDSED